MHVFIIAAITQDGFIARSTNEPALWSSKEDKLFFHARTKQAGLLVMGQTTYNTIGRPLPGRITIVYTNHPEKIPNSQDILKIENWKLEIDTSLYTTNLPIPQFVTLLTEKMYPELAVCGGSSIYTQFMESGLVSTLYITQEAIRFGSGIPLFTTAKLPEMATKITPLSPTTTLFEYIISNNK